jgi:hypothetical protein
MLCAACHTYQDWRRWLPVSPTVLALLTALISVLGLAVPVLYSTFHTPVSETYIEHVSLDGTTLRVVATNKGDAPASFWRAQVSGDYLAPATRIRLRDDADAIIPPGSKLLVFDIVPLLSEEQSYDLALEAYAAVLAKEPLPETRILFSVSESTGLVNIYPIAIGDLDMHLLLRANADRCSAIAEKNFQNGCIGPGETEEEQFRNAVTGRAE